MIFGCANSANHWYANHDGWCKAVLAGATAEAGKLVARSIKRERLTVIRVLKQNESDIMSIEKMISLHRDVAGNVNEALAKAAYHAMHCSLICTSCADASQDEPMDTALSQTNSVWFFSFGAEGALVELGAGPGGTSFGAGVGLPGPGIDYENEADLSGVNVGPDSATYRVDLGAGYNRVGVMGDYFS